jgi:hypothetical protein
MAHPSRQLSLIKDPIDVIFRRLAALPPSPEVEDLCGKAKAYLRMTDDWKASPPTAEERNWLMKRVLELHVQVAKLEREIAGG